MTGLIGNRNWDRKDWLIAAALFVVLSSIYYATASGITSSNDGSHYALVRTMVDNHAFALQQFDDYAEGNDIAIAEDGRLFSDRPPGTALTAGLFYFAAGALPESLHTLPSRHDAQNPRLGYVLLLPPLAGAGAAVLLYALMRLLAASRAASMTAVLMFAMGTVHWKYSSVLYSHALSSFLVILAIYMTVRIVDRGGEAPAVYGFLGLVLGFSVLSEYSNGLLVIILIAYLLVADWPLDWQKTRHTWIPLIVGGLLSALFLALYNYLNFGSPFHLSYRYAINYPWAGSFATTFNFPLSAGLKGLLFGGAGDGWCGGPCLNKGLFQLSPILWLALPGYYFFYRQARRECLLTVVVFIAYLFLFARHRTFHGFTADGRYLAPYLGLLALPLAFMLQWIFDLRTRPILRLTLLALAAALFVASAYNIFLHIGTSYNYHLDIELTERFLDNLFQVPQILSQVFRNTANLPALWLIEGFAFAALAGAAFALHKARRRRYAASD